MASPDGARIYVTGNVSPGVYLTISYNAANGDVVWKRRYAGPTGSGDVPSGMAVSPDSLKVYVTGQSVGGLIELGGEGGTTRDHNYLTIAYPAQAFVRGGDTNPPTTTAAAQTADGSPYTFSTFTNKDVTITLSCVDDGGGTPSGCKETKFCASGGICTPATLYSSPFTITGEGTTHVCFSSQDNAGNVEATKCSQVHIDKTAPVTTKTVGDSDGDGFVDSITLNAEDLPTSPATVASGVKEIKYSVNGGPMVTVSGSSANVSLPDTDTMTITFFAVDNAGNAEPSHTQEHKIDFCRTAAGSYQGCPVGDKNIVSLHMVNIGGGSSTKVPLDGISVRVFDRNNPDFRAVAGSKNPNGSLYGVVYEADAGRVGRCTTGSDGICFAGEVSTGDYLVIIKFVDTTTQSVVYVGRPKSPSDFVDSNGDSVPDLATKEFQVIRVHQKGVFKEYRGGSKIVVTGSTLEVIIPESTVWAGTQSLYPFIFTSDSDWTTDVCAEVPAGYRISGVYDENGNLISAQDCVQTIVANTTKIIAFEVNEIGSPEPEFNAVLTVKRKGKTTKHSIKVSDIRRATHDQKVKEVKGKFGKPQATTGSRSLSSNASRLLLPGDSLWSITAAILNGQMPNDQIKLFVKRLAESNQINIPEWGVNNGKLDARKLQVGLLIDLAPVLEQLR